jgi:hypothetical protein
MPGDAERETGDHEQHHRAGCRRQEPEVRRRLPQERQADDNRGKSVEKPAQRTREAGAIGRAEPGDRIGETEHDPTAPRKPARFGERAQEIGSSQHDERPADERHETGKIGTTSARQRQG